MPSSAMTAEVRYFLPLCKYFIYITGGFVEELPEDVESTDNIIEDGAAETEDDDQPGHRRQGFIIQVLQI